MAAMTRKKMINNSSEKILIGLFVLGMLMVNNISYAGDANPFAKNYKEQNTGKLKSLEASPDTKIYVSNHKEDDNISMLENGYDMIGSSGFSATETSSDLALAHGKAIKADTVLFYRKYESASTASSKLQLIKEAAKTGGEIDPNDLEEGPTQYRFYASYWAKLPMPLFGVHVIKLKRRMGEDEPVTEQAGLKAIAVIKDSPAANAAILRGDTLLKMGDVVLNTPEDLFVAVKRYSGQSVAINLERNNEAVQVIVALNKRN